MGLVRGLLCMNSVAWALEASITTVDDCANKSFAHRPILTGIFV